MNEAVKEAIRTGKTALGIEFGSTRTKEADRTGMVWS